MRIKICFCIVFCLVAFYSIGQQADTSRNQQSTQSVQDSSTRSDSLSIDSASSFLRLVQNLASQERQKSMDKYNDGKIAIQQRNLIDEVIRTTQRVKIYLKNRLDSVAIEKEMQEIAHNLAVAKDGVLINQGTIQTQRNLSVSAAIVSNLLIQIDDRKATLDDYTSELIGLRDRIDSLTADSILYHFSEDSANVVKYVKRLAVVSREINPADSLLSATLNYTQALQNRVDLLAFDLKLTQEEIEAAREYTSLHVAEREVPNIWAPVTYERPFDEIVKFSIEKEILALGFYIKENKLKTFLLFVFIAAFYRLLRSMKRHMQQQEEEDHYVGPLVVKSPLASAIVIVICLHQFAFLDPPYIFTCVLWLTAAIALYRILKGFITGFWLSFWGIMIGYFTLSGLENLTLQASRVERWFMLALSISSLIYCSFLLLSKHRKVLQERKIIYFICFLAVFELVSTLTNIFGRYNLGKTFMASGFSSLVVGILFLWTLRLLNETLQLAGRIYEYPDKKLFYINFNKIGDKVPVFFYVVLVVGWFILIGRHFYSFKQITEPFIAFLTTPRTVGDYSFTVNGLFVFVIILFCSLTLSRIISFFASEEAGPTQQTLSSPLNPTSNAGTPSTKSTKLSLGSWILLIRIFIISIGLFLAFAAAGIPLDKISLILGALGVGIGLGLQGLVNNLVSGLIIAFEKPVNVGDFIEIDGKLGTMKSIGFRSSVVGSIDGPSIVVPNGDLLNQSVINYTMGKNLKRNVLKIGVAYGTDLEKATAVWQKLLEEDDRILKQPVPMIYAKNFGNSSIDYELQYWVYHIRESQHMQSDLIERIKLRFKEEGIEIPFPQQDVYVKSVPTGLKGDPASGGKEKRQ